MAAAVRQRAPKGKIHQYVMAVSQCIPHFNKSITGMKVAMQRMRKVAWLKCPSGFGSDHQPDLGTLTTFFQPTERHFRSRHA